MAVSQPQVFCKPEIPFIHPLQVEEGKSIIIIGKILPKTGRFHVNLKCGSHPDADIALHFNPRYEGDLASVVLNTFQKGSWALDERKSDFCLPQDQLFILQILVTKQKYKISVNGEHLMDYVHRIPITRVDTISVDQMVNLDFIAYQNPVVVPYKTEISGGLQPGRDIVIYGLPNPDSKLVAFQFKDKNGIEFHYESYLDENVVVHNTSENEKWEDQKSADVPFKKDQLFKATISCDKEKFTVIVNGQQAHTYKHRFAKLEDINGFKVSGDLRLFFVQI